MSTEWSDEALMQAFQNGDNDALSILYSRYQRPLRAYLHVRLGHDSDSADDIIQELFIRVTKHKSSFIAGRLFRPWAYAIADRLAKNHNRNRHFREDWHKQHSELSATVDHDTPERAFERSERFSALPGVVSGLPQHLKETVGFFLLHDVSYESAQASLGVTPMAIWRRLDAACRAIRLGLDECADTEPPIDLELLEEIVAKLSKEEFDSLGRAIFSPNASRADLDVLQGFLNSFLEARYSRPCEV